MIELFAVLRKTSSLKLSAVFLKSLTSHLQNGMCVLECIQTPFHNLTRLELGTAFNKHYKAHPLLLELKTSGPRSSCLT
ncbi:hypothetical protein ACHQM5_025040 [Ranunculus cassubicifolius]